MDEWILQYRGPHGWWVGHAGVPLRDPVTYVRHVNSRRSQFIVRAINKNTGEIVGDQTRCAFCGEPHPGLDGECLL